jgi:hypothetical protein
MFLPPPQRKGPTFVSAQVDGPQRNFIAFPWGGPVSVFVCCVVVLRTDPYIGSGKVDLYWAYDIKGLPNINGAQQAPNNHTAQTRVSRGCTPGPFKPPVE